MPSFPLSICVGGLRYVVCAPEASTLANSFDTVERRIADRGRLCSPLLPRTLEFSEFIYSNEIFWAPDKVKDMTEAM